MFRLHIYLAMLLLAASSVVMADEGDDSGGKQANYCLDQDTNQQWAALAAKHKDSDTWQRLFALRIGLCAMVDSGGISVDRATRIFERQRMKGVAELEGQIEPEPFGQL